MNAVVIPFPHAATATSRPGQPGRRIGSIPPAPAPLPPLSDGLLAALGPVTDEFDRGLAMMLTGTVPYPRALVIIRGCEICYGTGRYFAKPGEMKDCPKGCKRPQTETAEQSTPQSAYGCPGCRCAPVTCELTGCGCLCCCPGSYPLPAEAVTGRWVALAPGHCLSLFIRAIRSRIGGMR